MRLNEITREVSCRPRLGAGHGATHVALHGRRAPTTDEVYEAAYRGNIGAMEMFKFYQVATPQEKDLMAKYLKLRQYDAAWKLLQQVTGVALK